MERVQCELNSTSFRTEVTGHSKGRVREQGRGERQFTESGKLKITKSRKEGLVHIKPVWICQLALMEFRPPTSH